MTGLGATTAAELAQRVRDGATVLVDQDRVDTSRPGWEDRLALALRPGCVVCVMAPGGKTTEHTVARVEPLDAARAARLLGPTALAVVAALVVQRPEATAEEIATKAAALATLADAAVARLVQLDLARGGVGR